MPAATDFRPSTTMAWARTVAVVVPSPALSLVLEATSRISWAPMFSNLSSSSISLATVTPSLVERGAPKDFSITTLRPLGPRVTFTALARMLTPRSMRVARVGGEMDVFGSHVSCSFSEMWSGERAVVRRPWRPLGARATPRMSLSFMISRSSPSILTSVPDHLPNRMRSPTFTSSAMSLPLSSRAPGPTAMTSPSCGFSLAVSGMMIPPLVLDSSSTRFTSTRSPSGRNAI